MTLPSYATRPQLALCAPPNALAGKSADAQDAAIAGASRTADDSFKKAGYVLPLVSWSDSLTKNVCYIALYDLLFAGGAAASASGLMYRQRFDDANTWLRRIENGLEPEGIVDSSTDATPDTFGVVIATRPRRGW